MIVEPLGLTDVVATTCAIIVFFLGLFWKADDAFSSQFREELSHRLRYLDVEKTVRGWPDYFAALFDKWFGKRHLSLRRIIATSIASVFWVIVLTGVWAILRPEEFDRWRAYGSLTALGLGKWFQGMAANILPDYFSLLETRWIIEKLKTAPSRWGVALWLILDFIATGVIFFLGYFLWLLISIPLGPSTIDDLVYALREFPRFLTQVLLPLHADPQFMFGLGAAPGIFFYSTFFTSLWAWLFALAQGMVRLASRMTRGVKRLKWALPLEKRPFWSVGLVSTILACISYLCVATVGWVVTGPAIMTVPVTDYQRFFQASPYCMIRYQYDAEAWRECVVEQVWNLYMAEDYLRTKFDFKEDADRMYHRCFQEHIAKSNSPNFSHLVDECLRPRIENGLTTGQHRKSGFQCESKQRCDQMVSCEEARYYYWKCGVVQLDGDEDGEPCEWRLCN